jgi:hypothetical protein
MDVANAFLFEHKLIMHLTWGDVNSRGSGFAPPSFWTIKEELSKQEFVNALPKALEELKEIKTKLAKNKVKIVLPYQYSDTEEDDDLE